MWNQDVLGDGIHSSSSPPRDCNLRYSCLLFFKVCNGGSPRYQVFTEKFFPFSIFSLSFDFPTECPLSGLVMLHCVCAPSGDIVSTVFHEPIFLVLRYNGCCPSLWNFLSLGNLPARGCSTAPSLLRTFLGRSTASSEVKLFLMNCATSSLLCNYSTE